MEKEKFLTELSRLLQFMSAWDRRAVLEKYRALFDAAEDPAALAEALGTPTKLAIDLARDYVPTPPPARRPAPQPEPLPDDPEDILYAVGAPVADLEKPAPVAFEPLPAPEPVQQEIPEMAAAVTVRPAQEEAPAPAPVRRRVRPGVLTLYLLGSVVIGLPVTVALLLLGTPVLGAGMELLIQAVEGAKYVAAAVSLVSDTLLAVGAALALGAVGLVISWLGLWISLALSSLWVERVMLAQGRRLCFEEEAAE